MKAKIRLRECYALTKHKRKQTTIRYISLLAVLTSMCLYAVKQVSAQQAKPAATAADIISSDAKSQYGMLAVHDVEGKLYLEIPDSLLGRDLLAVNRIAKGWAGDKPFDPFLNFLGYSGDLMGETLFRFDKESDGTLNLYIVDYSDRIQANDGTPMLPPNADLLPVFHSFLVLCRNNAGDASVIDGTDFLSGDNAVMTFSSTLRKKFGVGSMSAQHSSLQGVEVTDTHTLVSSVKTYGYRNGESVRLAIRSTWFLLSKIPYEIREPDHRVGYYTQAVRDYSDPFKPERSLRMVKRWRMEPRPEDREAYFRGELVEPRKPIIIYIDPEMPKEWVPYMIQGVNDWQQAFEQAGFKNAIRGERVPTEMKDMMVGDARYPMINYKPNHIRNATTEVVTDPRSGEILNAHIAWWHGHMRNFIKWGFVMAAIHRQSHWENESDTAFIGAMIRKTAAHEVGHVLGLRHNFGASSTVPVENLRNREWLTDNAISPSIMDYVRVNYVAQPEDDVPLSGLVPRIGTYDRWAIEWGYRYWPSSGNPKADCEQLDNWTAAMGGSNMHWFGAEELQYTNARCRAEDLGDNPARSAVYGMRNLKRLADKAANWDEYLTSLGLGWSDLFDQYANYLKHIMATLNEPSENQTKIFAFLNQHFFDPPAWLPKPNPKEGIPDLLHASMQKLNQEIIPQLIVSTAKRPDAESILALQKLMFDSGSRVNASNTHRRAVQHTYVSSLCDMLDEAETHKTLTHESRLVLHIAARALHQRLRNNLRGSTDRLTSTHLTEMIQKLSKILTSS